MSVRVYRARHVLPISRPPLRDGAVAVDGDRITFVGPAPAAPNGLTIELGDAVLLPGLVNAHAHLELTVMRGFLEDLAFRPWILRLTKARERVMTPERRAASARLGIAEGLLAGITSYGDVSDSGASLEAMRDCGVRGVMFREVFGPDPAQCAEAMRDLRAGIDVARARATARVRVGVSPHAPYTVSDALFGAVAAFATDERLPLTVHIAESADEQSLVVRGAGAFADVWRARGIAVSPRAPSPIELLERTGILATRPLLVHAVRATARDLERVRASGSAIAFCPASNAKLGHGIAPLAGALASGICCGLGSDSVASGNRMDLLDDARLAILQQRAHTGRPDAPSASDLLRLATAGGAEALGIEAGVLAPGKAADLVAFPLDPVRDTPAYGIEDALVFGAAGRRASLVVVDGVELVRSGALLRDVRDDITTVRGTARDLAALDA